jgi:hypothetical protein
VLSLGFAFVIDRNIAPNDGKDTVDPVKAIQTMLTADGTRAARNHQSVAWQTNNVSTQYIFD